MRSPSLVPGRWRAAWTWRARNSEVGNVRATMTCSKLPESSFFNWDSKSWTYRLKRQQRYRSRIKFSSESHVTLSYLSLKACAIWTRCSQLRWQRTLISAFSSVPRPFMAAWRASASALALKSETGQTVGRCKNGALTFLCTYFGLSKWNDSPFSSKYENPRILSWTGNQNLAVPFSRRM